MYKYIDDKLVFEYTEIKPEKPDLVKGTLETSMYTHFPQKEYVDSNNNIWCPICCGDTNISYPVNDTFCIIHDFCNTELIFITNYISVAKNV